MDNRRLFLAAVLSMAVLLGWQLLFPAPKPSHAPVPEAAVPAPAAQPTPGGEAAPPAGAATPQVASGGAAAASPATVEPEIGEASERKLVIESDTLRAEVTNLGGEIVSLELKGVKEQSGAPVELVQKRPSGPYPLALTLPKGEPHPLNGALFAVETSHPDELELRYRGPLGSATKRIHLRPGGLVEIDVEAQPAGFGMLLGPGLRARVKEGLSNRFDRRYAVWRHDGSTETLEAGKAKEVAEVPGADLGWVGLEDTYFLTAFIPREPVARARYRPVLLSSVAGDPLSFSAQDYPASGELSSEQKALPRDYLLEIQAASERLSLTSFWGSKQYDRLAALPYGLEKSIRWGTFGIVARPLLAGLQWIHGHVVANYGWSIVLLTTLLKLLLLPLSIAAFRSMRKMQALNPRMQAIREKWRPKMRDKQGRFNADAQRQMNEEIMALYRTEGVNPAGGCLPMLVQLPIFLAFYNLLSSAVELWQAPWLGWIHDLSAPDPYYLLPIVMGASQVLQQRMTPPPPDPFQRRMIQMLPIVFTVFSLGFPSGLVIYWLTNNLVSIAQQKLYNRMQDDSRAAAATPAIGGKRKGSA